MVVQVFCLMLVGQVQDVNIVGGVPAVPTAQEIANAIVGALNGSGGVGPDTSHWTMEGNGFNGVAPDKNQSPEPSDLWGGADAQRSKVLNPSTFGYDNGASLGSKEGFKTLFAPPVYQRGNPVWEVAMPFYFGSQMATVKFDMSHLGASVEYPGGGSTTTGNLIEVGGNGPLQRVLGAVRYGLAGLFGLACAMSFAKFIGRG